MVPSAKLPTAQPQVFGDSSTSVAFQQARHQNNLYYAQELLRSADDDAGSPSTALTEMHKVIVGVAADIAKNPSLTLEERLQRMQDALAMQHLYMERDEIKSCFFSGNDLKPNLIAATLDETAWGNLAFALMESSVAGYNAYKGKQPDGSTVESETGKAYVALAADLAQINSPKNLKKPTNRNDLWVAAHRYMEPFPKKAGFTPEKIKRHEAYLETEFLLLGANEWFTKLTSDEKSYVAQSRFRERVRADGVNPELKRQTMIRVSSEPRRGATAYQGASAQDRTRRASLKNSPFDMVELASLINAAHAPKFDSAVAGSKPPVSKLAGLDNPFNEAVFKIFNKWYILAAHVGANGELTMQKIELEVVQDSGQPVMPRKDDKGNYVRKEGAPSLLNTADVRSANDGQTPPKTVPLMDMVEKGLETLVKACGYGVVANNSSDEVMQVNIDAEANKGVLFAMDDRALLREWLLQDGLDLEKGPAHDAVFAGVAAPDEVRLVQAFKDARDTSKTSQDRRDALETLYAFFHANPAACGKLAEHAAIAAVAHDSAHQNQAAAIAAYKNRANDNGAEFKKLVTDAKDIAAFKAIFWGDVMAEFEALRPAIDAMQDGPQKQQAISDLVKKLNVMIAKDENTFGPVKLDQLVVPLSTDPLDDIFNILDSNRKQLSIAAMGSPFVAAHIIPMPDARPFTDADRKALEAIALTNVLRQMIEAAKQTPPLTIDEMRKAYQKAIKEEGILPELDKTALAKLASPDDILFHAACNMQDRYNSYNRPDLTVFQSEHLAMSNIVNAVAAARKLAAAGTSTFSDAFLAAPPSKKDFDNACLTPVGRECALRQYNQVTGGMGWVLGASTANGEQVRVATAAGGIDYMSVGLMHLCNKRPQPKAGDPLLTLTLTDGTAVLFHRCAAPAGDTSGRAYFKFTDKNGADLHLSREQNIELEDKLMNEMKAYAKEAMKQGGAQHDVDVPQITRDPNDRKGALVDGKPVDGPDPSAKKGLGIKSQ